jgi:hypothetical protein
VTAVLVELPLPLAPAPAPAAVSFSVRDIGVRASAVAGAAQSVTITVTSTAPLDAVAVSVQERRRNVGPLNVTMKPNDATTVTGTVTLPFAGEWTATVSARSGAFDEARRTMPLPETSP